MPRLAVASLLVLSIAAAAGAAVDPRWGDFVPGEILIQVAASAAPAAGGGLLPAADPALAAAIADLGIFRAEPLFVPAPPAGLDRWGLGRDFRLIGPADLDVLAACRSLEQLAAVEWAEPNLICRAARIPNDPKYADKQWDLPLTMCPAAWDVQLGVSETVIAVIDSGIDLQHPDLMNVLWSNPLEAGGTPGADDDANGYIDDIHGFDWVHGDGEPMDDEGHGTHVSGIANAHTDNGVGVAGVAWNCSTMALKVLNSAGTGTVGNSAAAITYAANNGAAVVNMSYGHGGIAAAETNAVNYAIAAGVILVGAAGNGGADGIGDPTCDYPGGYESVITVGATNRHDVKADFSNYGEGIDLMAPGAGIHSTAWDSGTHTYKTYGGTSMSSPFVAGQAALLHCRFPGLTPDEVRNRISQSADNIDEFNPDYVGGLGGGRSNVFYSLLDTSYPDVIDYELIDTGGDEDGYLDSNEDIEMRIEVKNQSWKEGSAIQLALVSPVAYVEIVTGSLAIGDLDAKAESAPSSPLRLRVTGEAPYNGLVELEFHFTMADGTRTQVIPLAVNDPNPERRGWPVATENGDILSSAALHDIDGDDELEIIVADGAGDLHVRNSDGSNVPGWPFSIDTQEDEAFFSISSPAVGDVDGDGQPEIVTVTYRVQGGPIESFVYVFEASGAVLPGFPVVVPMEIKSSPTLADLEGDGCLEIMAGSYQNLFYVWDCHGALKAGWPIDLGTDVFGTAAVADLEGDGDLEIVVTTKDDAATPVFGRVHVFSAGGGALPGWPRQLPGQVYPSAALVDLDGDGSPLEIVVACGDYANTAVDDAIYVFRADGSDYPGWPKTMAASIYASPAIADIDADSRPDIVTATVGGELFVHSASGALLPGFPVSTGAETRSSPAAADIDGDGWQEILIGADDGGLHAFAHDGTVVAGYPFETGTLGVFSSAAVDDLNGDGSLEVVFSDYGGYIHVLDLSAPVSIMDWPRFHGDDQRTGQFHWGPTGVQLVMPGHMFRPGSACGLQAFVTNDGSSTLSGYPLFGILDVYGAYYFAPAWTTEIGWITRDWPAGRSLVTLIPGFTWPDEPSSASGLAFWGALTTPAMNELFGDFAYWAFAFGP